MATAGFAPISAAAGQGWAQLAQLGVALALCAAVGLERELRQKSAGLRTHALVGFGAALIMLVSKYGFADVLGDHIVLDPSRVAAQIVSGIGFIGAGLIFVRHDAVRGLTTAASIWLVAAIGMAAGAGLWLLAVVVTAGHFVIAFAFPLLTVRLPRSRFAASRIHLTYADGQGVLRQALAECTRRRFTVAELTLDQQEDQTEPRTVSVWLIVQGAGTITGLLAGLADVRGVLSVSGDDANTPTA